MKFKSLIAIAFFAAALSLFAESAVDRVKKALEEKDYEAAAANVPAALAEKPKDFDLHILAGDIYMELGKPDEAISAYKKAVDIDDEETEGLRKLGLAYSAKGNHTEAVKQIRRAIKEKEKEAANYLALSQAYIAADSLVNAEIAINRALELDKKSPAAFVAYGDYYFASRVYELARQNYEEALQRDENLLEARQKLATAYWYLGNTESDPDLANELFTRSLQSWNKITQQDPKNAKAWFEQGKILFLAKKYQDAASSLYEFLRQRPSGSIGRWWLAQSLYELGLCDSAAPQLEIVAREIDTVSAKANLLLARCYANNKQYDKANAAFANLRANGALDPTDLRIYGQTAFQGGDTSRALEIWSEVVNKDPENNCQLMYILGSQYVTLKRYDDAVAMLNKRLTTGKCSDSLNGKVYYMIGTSYLFNNKTDSAIVNLARAQELDPSFLYSGVYLGDAFAQLKQNDKAEEQFQKVIAAGAANPAMNQGPLTQAYAKLASMKLEQKKYAELSKLASQWASIAPESPYAYLYWAVGAQGSGDTDAACRNYRKVLQLDPKNSNARKNLEGLNCK